MDALSAKSPPMQSALAGKRAGKQVLIALADEAVRVSLHKILQGAGYPVAAAADAQKVLDCSEQHDPDLLLLDLDFPWDSLRHVLKWLPARKRLLPVIGMTTMPEKLKPGLVIRLGPVLELPVEVPILLKRIEDVFALGNNAS